MKRTELDEFLDGLTQGQREGGVEVRSTSQRINQVVDEIVEQGRCVVLTGEPGNGKTRLAEESGHEISIRLGHKVTAILLPPPPRLPTMAPHVFVAAFPDLLASGTEAIDDSFVNIESTLDPTSMSSRLLQLIQERAGGHEVVLIAPGIDHYSPRAEHLLEALVRSRELRVIATAQRLSGAAGRLTYDPAVSVLPVGPMNLSEANDYLSQLLRVERIEQSTLQRWHAISQGNGYALATLAFACDRRGVVTRRRGAAFVKEGNDAVPGEFADYLQSSSTPDEMRTLESIVVAEPIFEAALLRRLNTASLANLYERGFIASQPMATGSVSIVTAHPLLAASIRLRLTGARYVEINDEVFQVLSEDQAKQQTYVLPERIMRLVTFGFECERSVPLDWMLTAFQVLRRGGGTAKLKIPLSLSIAQHPEAPIAIAVEAALDARWVSRVSGKSESLRHSIAVINALLVQRGHELEAMERVVMRFVLLEEQMWAGAPEDELFAELDALALKQADDSLGAFIESARGFMCIALGYMKDAAVHSGGFDEHTRYQLTGMRSVSLFTAAFVMQQRGQIAAAVQMATRGRRFALLGEFPRADQAEVHGYCALLGHWAVGNSAAGKQLLEEYSHPNDAGDYINRHHSGLYESAEVLFAMQEGRWSEAAQSADALLERLQSNDSYGVQGVVQASFALSLAVLGERAAAQQALKDTQDLPRGFSLALSGHLKIMRLRTMQWLHSNSIVDEAQDVIHWARREQLEFIELQALHIVACETGEVSAETLHHALQLAMTVDQPMGNTLYAHLHGISVAGPGIHPSTLPESRVLAELGVWTPLPYNLDMTPREREVALFAALGYSNRLISEQLHISIRTVETHLGRVFAKVGTDNRDGLRKWFSQHHDEMVEDGFRVR